MSSLVLSIRWCFFFGLVSSNRVYNKETRRLGEFGRLGGPLWVLGVDIIHLYTFKNIFIFFGTYIHISYLDTLCSSHQLCVPQTQANSTMEFKSFLKFCRLKIEAKFFLTPIVFNYWHGFKKWKYGKWFQKWDYSPLIWWLYYKLWGNLLPRRCKNTIICHNNHKT